jgi:N-acetylglutamate synthase-like GNAT family acetyltransferase
MSQVTPESYESIRPAHARDQKAIRQLVRAARLAPFGLKWPTFVIAEKGGAIIGVGQIKGHRDGSRELASLAVAPGFQAQGVGSALVHALLERETGPVYMFCREGLEGFYRRFSFHRAESPDLPATIARLLSLANVGMRLLGVLSGRRLQIIAMRKLAEKDAYPPKERI